MRKLFENRGVAWIAFLVVVSLLVFGLPAMVIRVAMAGVLMVLFMMLLWGLHDDR